MAVCFVMIFQRSSNAITGSIEGKITDTYDGKTIEGVNVILIEELDDESVVSTVLSDSGGYYKVTPLREGEKHLFVWAPGFAPERLTVQSGSDNQTLNLALKKSAVVQGSIKDSLANPVYGAEVRIVFLETPQFPFSPDICNCTTKTDNAGNFFFRSVEPSRKLKVMASHPDFETYVSDEMILSFNETLSLNIALTTKEKD
jgi:hypothetical protein